MWLDSLIIKKENLTVVNENTTVQEVADLFNQQPTKKFRALPILDRTGVIFRGNIYKQHVMQHQLENGDMTISVTNLMRNATKFVSTEAKFYELFFALGDLPFISVIDDQHHFHGIITHTALMDQLAQSWSVKTAKVALAVTTDSKQGHLAIVAKIIAKYTVIDAVITLHTGDNQEKLVFTLPLRVNDDLLVKITNRLNKKGYLSLEIENLEQFQA